jgi:hypothetical protein
MEAVHDRNQFALHGVQHTYARLQLSNMVNLDADEFTLQGFWVFTVPCRRIHAL